ncbi:MAG: tRNA1(Val) (adenine(37)-N6)-methyltransferase [Flavobacteriaceae bacterium]|jgi:tRNA1Val (adenine37-N6)-methyltransferase
MPSSIFRFKAFAIEQEKVAMKIGTDGVLLGAWAEIPERAKNILDIGTGSGLLSLQAAQRTSGSAQILGVDIDRSAVKTATENFKNSSWSSCLTAKEWDITAETKTLGTENFDCVLCNPPYFEGGPVSSKRERNMARVASYMSWPILFERIASLLSDKGVANLILPFESFEKALKLAQDNGLYLKRYCLVKGHKDAPFKRVLMSLSREKSEEIKEEELIIEVARHQYTKAYYDLVQPFYLKL